ncbi:MAG: hypothetical protein K8T91_11120 [Planctomycetes bacterium]|nr:hypothetical protein [Planctomycetota bacterium]
MPMLSPGCCDKCGEIINPRKPWRLVEFTIEPPQERKPVARYHAPCFKQWETVPYVVDGQPCELYKRRAEHRCECCMKLVDTTGRHGMIAVSQIMEGLRIQRQALGLFCTECVEGKRIELVKSTERE